jgi:hypothetical protein
VFKTPGVGAYEVKPVLKHTPHVKMATSKRSHDFLVSTDAATTPGPGMYSSRSSFVSVPLPKVQKYKPVLQSRR